MPEKTFTATEIINGVNSGFLDDYDVLQVLKEIGVDLPNRKLKVLIEIDLNQDDGILDEIAKYTADDLVRDWYDAKIDSVTVLSASWVDEELAALS